MKTGKTKETSASFRFFFGPTSQQQALYRWGWNARSYLRGYVVNFLATAEKLDCRR